MLNERRLHWMQIVSLGETLNGGDIVTFVHQR
jgi:hypothetical protein